MKQYNFKINGHDYEVAVNKISEGVASVSVNGEAYQVEVQSNTMLKPGPRATAQVAPAKYSATGASSVNTGSGTSGAASGAGAAVKSPLPGVILDVKVREGDRVAAGQSLMVLEAMKMENNIDAPTAGTVRSIHKKQGDSVLEGDILLTIE